MKEKSIHYRHIGAVHCFILSVSQHADKEQKNMTAVSKHIGRLPAERSLTHSAHTRKL